MRRYLKKYGFLDNRGKSALSYGPTNIGEDLEKYRRSPAAMLH
jgi:hypothetical protein